MSSRIITLPNLLTMFRMALIPVFVSLLFYRKFEWALFVFVLAGVTDGLDGLLARRLNQGPQPSPRKERGNGEARAAG